MIIWGIELLIIVCIWVISTHNMGFFLSLDNTGYCIFLVVIVLLEYYLYRKERATGEKATSLPISTLTMYRVQLTQFSTECAILSYVSLFFLTLLWLSRGTLQWKKEKNTKLLIDYGKSVFSDLLVFYWVRRI